MLYGFTTCIIDNFETIEDLWTSSLPPCSAFTCTQIDWYNLTYSVYKDVTSSYASDRYPLIYIIGVTQGMFERLCLMISCFEPDTMLVIVNGICGAQVPSQIFIRPYVCARKCILLHTPQSHHLHYHHDCYGSLQRCKFAGEQIRQRTSNLFDPNIKQHTQKKKKERIRTLCLHFSPSVFTPTLLFFGLYLLYVYIKQFQIL